MGCSMSGGTGKLAEGAMADIKTQDLEDIANKLRVLSIQCTQAAKSGYVLIDPRGAGGGVAWTRVEREANAIFKEQFLAAGICLMDA